MDFQEKLLKDKPWCVLLFWTNLCKTIGCADFINIKGIIALADTRTDHTTFFVYNCLKKCPQNVTKFLKTRYLSKINSFFSVNFVVDVCFLRSTRRCRLKYFFILRQSPKILVLFGQWRYITPNLAISKIPSGINKRINWKKRLDGTRAQRNWNLLLQLPSQSRASAVRPTSGTRQEST